MTDWEKVRQIIAENFVTEEEEIGEDTDLVKEFDATSLDLYELVAAVQTEFGLEPDEEDPVGNVRTAGDLLALACGTVEEE